MPDDPEAPVWSVIRLLSDRIGEGVSSQMRAIARVDFNATSPDQRDLDDDRLSNLIEAVSTKRLGLEGVEADEGELRREATIRKFRIVRTEGQREVAREIEHHELMTAKARVALIEIFSK